MKFIYKDIEISRIIQADIQKIIDIKESVINNKNIIQIGGLEEKIYPNINPDEIILVAENYEEELLLGQNIIENIGTNTYTYSSNENPKINSNIINPLIHINFIWINKISGELFICTDNTINNNIWIGQKGTTIKPTGAFTINDELLFNFDMNSLTGNKVSSSTIHDGTMYNCKITQGVISNGLSFKGNSKITVNGILPDISGKIDMNFWIFPTTFSCRQNIISKCYSGELSLVQERDGTITFLFGNSGIEGVGQFNTFKTINSLTINKWTHISIQRIDKDNVKIYFDGILVLLEPTLLAISFINSSNNNLLIGNGYAGGYNGSIDDFYFHTRNITIEERQYLISKRSV